MKLLYFFNTKSNILPMFNKNFSKEPTEKQKIGEIGENFACAYLKENGHTILDRNYLKKWGELDIVSKKGKIIHFVEVKAVSRDLSDVNHETYDSYRAEDNMHPWKLKRLSRAVQYYLLDKDVSDETDWQFDLATVYIDKTKGLHRVFLLEDIVL